MTRRDLHVLDEPAPSASSLRGEADLVRALTHQGTLDPLDHEALLALALGDEVVEEPALESERVEADRLRAALEGEGTHPLAELALALRHAKMERTPALGHADHEALLALSLRIDVPSEPESDAERIEAERLRLALEDDGSHPLAELVTSLRAANAPGGLDEVTHERLLRRALHSLDDRGRDAEASGRATAKMAARPSRWAMASGLLALAAGVALLVSRPTDRAPAVVASKADAPGAPEAVAVAPRVSAPRGGSAFDPAEDAAGRRPGRANPPAGAAPMAAAEPTSASAPRRGRAADDAFADGASATGGTERKRAFEGAPRAESLAAAEEASPRAEVTPFAEEASRSPERVAFVPSEIPPTDGLGRRAVRSTSALFDPAMPFPTRGGESERLGRIVASRAADLRANRFAAWGIR